MLSKQKIKVIILSLKDENFQKSKEYFENQYKNNEYKFIEIDFGENNFMEKVILETKQHEISLLFNNVGYLKFSVKKINKKGFWKNNY
jgi:short-subunit dehydrogenase